MDMIRSVICACLLAFSCSAEWVDKAPEFPDLDRNGKHIVNIYEVKGQLQPYPDRAMYADFYKSYSVRAVKSLPDILFDSVDSAEMFALGAEVSQDFIRSQSQLGLSEEQLSAFQMQHTGIGFLLKDYRGVEIGRVAISFYAVDPAKADAPVLVDGKCNYKARAVTAFSLSKGAWENGYWTWTKSITKLDLAEYRRALQLSQSYAQTHPFQTNLQVVQGSQKSVKAVTCSMFVEYMIKMVANKDAFKDHLSHVGYTTADVANTGRRIVNDANCINAKFTVPAWYDSQGDLIDTSTTESPKELLVLQPKSIYSDNNYLTAEQNRLVVETYDKLFNLKPISVHNAGFLNK